MERENDIVVDLGDVTVETRGPLAAGVPDNTQGYNIPGLALTED